MFRCEITGTLSEAGESPEFVVIEKRRKQYFGIKTKKRKFKKTKVKHKKIEKPQEVTRLGEGWEVSKQIMVRKSTLVALEQQGKVIKCDWVS